MKKLLITLAMSLLLAAVCLASPADTDTEGEVKVGPTFTNVNGYNGRVGEYDPADDTYDLGFLPMVRAHTTVWSKNIYLNMTAAHSGNASDQRYSVDFDAARVFRTKFLFNKFLHRYDHDPLTNIDSSQGVVRTWATDESPQHEYRINYSDMRSDSVFQIPEADWLKFEINYRHQERTGAQQGMQVSKCSGCHVRSMPREVEESTNHFAGTVAVDTKHFGMSYTYNYRKIDQGTPAMYFTWDSAVHPGTGIDMFTSRSLYDQRTGELPGNLLGQNTKNSHTGKVYGKFNDTTRLSGAVVYSDVKNDYNDLNLISRFYNGRFTTLFKYNILFNARARFTNIDNASTYVDLPQMRNVAGPQAGQTYSESYPEFGDSSFTRNSGLSRKNTEVDLDLSIPIQRHRFTFLYAYDKIERDNYIINQSENHRFDFGFRTNPRKVVSARFRYRIDKTTTPFANVGAALAPALQPYPSVPANPFGQSTQYFEIYHARQATLSNQPTLTQNFEGMGTWKAARNLGFNLTYKYQKQKNDELNYWDWSQSYSIVNGNMWIVPEQHLAMTLGVNYTNFKTETLINQPVWNG